MSLISVEYMCPEHDRFEALVERPAFDFMSCPHCGALAPWVVSAPRVKIPTASVSTGKSSGPPSLGYLDTRALGDGMPLKEWKAQRAEYHSERRRRELRELL